MRWSSVVLLVLLAGCVLNTRSQRSAPPAAPLAQCQNIVVTREGTSAEPVWDLLDTEPPSNVARFMGGEITLPAGWTNVCTRGRDSQTGYFAGPGGLRIDYDVGGSNPVLTQEPGETALRQVRTQRVGGVPLQYGWRGTQLLATFLMVRPANFTADVMDDGESEQVLEVITSFKPTPCALRTCRASTSQLARAMAAQRGPIQAAR